MAGELLIYTGNYYRYKNSRDERIQTILFLEHFRDYFTIMTITLLSAHNDVSQTDIPSQLAAMTGHLSHKVCLPQYILSDFPIDPRLDLCHDWRFLLP